MAGLSRTKEWHMQNNIMVMSKKMYAGYHGNAIWFLNSLYGKVRVFTQAYDGEVPKVIMEYIW